MVKRMGIDHDKPLREWKASLNGWSNSNNHPRTFIIVGDNIDKRIAPRNMRVDHQVQSLHYFHAYAALNRIDTQYLDDSKAIGEVGDLPLSTFLPSSDDCAMLSANFVVLVARILVQHMPFLEAFRKCVPQHIQHEYSEVMKQKSTVVRT